MEGVDSESLEGVDPEGMEGVEGEEGANPEGMEGEDSKGMEGAEGEEGPHEVPIKVKVKVKVKVKEGPLDPIKRPLLDLYWDLMGPLLAIGASVTWSCNNAQKQGTFILPKKIINILTSN
jgi:hypothetical protein